MNEEIFEELELHNREFIRLIRELNKSISDRSERDLKLTEAINELAKKELAIPEQIKATIENPTTLTIPDKQKVEVENWPKPPDSLKLEKPEWWEEYPTPPDKIKVEGKVEISNLPEYPKEVNLKQPKWWKEPKETDMKGLKEHLSFLVEGLWEATKQLTQRVKITNQGKDEVIPVILYTPEGQPYTILSHGGSGGGGGGGGVTSTTETTPTAIGTNQQNVTTAGTRVQLPNNLCLSVTIKAKDTNTGLIYVGNVTVDSTNGFILSAGEPMDIAINNTNKIYIDSAVNGEGISFAFIL